MSTGSFPRVVIAGLSGGSGKTLVSVSLLLEARGLGIPARAFKKGPDYIDAAWLSWASGASAHNLDTWMMGFERVAQSFGVHAARDGFNLIEGNRGLYDGVDTSGTHSTAALAKALHAPVVLVVDATKMTRTAAAVVLGCQNLDPEVRIAGVILNQVSGARHESVLRGAIESDCGVPILGAIPRASEATPLPMRHLGLVTPAEHSDIGALASGLRKLTADRFDLDRLSEISRSAPPLPLAPDSPRTRAGSAVKIGYVRDAAFTFYYPENLDALRDGGAELVPVSAISAAELPSGLDALYLGGGFPETHARALSANTGLLSSLRAAAQEGMPVYAECGGLMLLARSLQWKGEAYPMAAVLPFDIDVCPAPQGHGYAELVVDRVNPFFPVGQRLRGHEFHYSRIVPDEHLSQTACAVLRGSGCYSRRDGVIAGNVWASYTHLHAIATPEWAHGLLNAARCHAEARAVPA